MRSIILILCLVSLPILADGYCQNTLEQLEEKLSLLEVEKQALNQQISVIKQTEKLVLDLNAFPRNCNDYNVYQNARKLFKHCDKAILIYKTYARPGQSCEFSGGLIRALINASNKVQAYTWIRTNPQPTVSPLVAPNQGLQYQNYAHYRKNCGDMLDRAENFAFMQVEQCKQSLNSFINRYNENNRRGYHRAATKLLKAYDLTPVFDIECYKAINLNMLSLTQYVVGRTWQACPQDIERKLLGYIENPTAYSQSELVDYCSKTIQRARNFGSYNRLEAQVNDIGSWFKPQAQGFDRVNRILNKCYDKSNQSQILTRRNKFAKLMIDLRLQVQYVCYRESDHHYFLAYANHLKDQLDFANYDYQRAYKDVTSDLNHLRGYYIPRRK